MLQRTPKREAKRRQMRRWRARDRSGVPYAGGDPSPETIAILIEDRWLAEAEAGDGHAIFDAMNAAIRARKKFVGPTTPRKR
jgi:hypothetical protein